MDLKLIHNSIIIYNRLLDVDFNASLSLTHQHTESQYFESFNGHTRHHLLAALAAATFSTSSQHALLTLGCARPVETQLMQHFEVKPPAQTYHIITRSVWLGVTHLGTINHMGESQSKSTVAASQIKSTFGLLQAACEVMEHLGSYGSSARTMLRMAGAADICLGVITAIKIYAACENDQTLGTNAISAAVATLQQVSAVAENADPASLRGIPIVYDILRSHVARPKIQQHGIQLMHILGSTHQGARRLDRIPGSWQWLGKVPSIMQPDDSRAHSSRPRACRWNATQLAAYLNLRGLRADSCNKLQHNVQELHTLALLPFEGESSETWQKRMLTFENQVEIKFLGAVIGRAMR